MKATVQKWGNSLGIRIPKNYADDLKIHDGSNVDIMVEDDKIIIARREKQTLAEKLSQISPENIHSEVITGSPIGNEEW